MNERDRQLVDDVMRRVHFIHALRAMFSPEIVKAVVFVASVTSVTLMIHIEQVIANIAQVGLTSYPGYLYGAFVHTTWPVQMVIVLGVAAGSWLAYDIAWHSRLVSRFHMRHA